MKEHSSNYLNLFLWLWVVLISYSIFFRQRPSEIKEIHNTLQVFQVHNNKVQTYFQNSSNVQKSSFRLPTKPYNFVFDDRPKDTLYKFTEEEVKMCVCGDFDCTEQSPISSLFPEPRPPFEHYKKSLKNSSIRTSAKTSIYKFENNILNIQAVAENGEYKKLGGDF